jgi:hypothetical protein
MVTAKWQDVNAREEVYRLVDRINRDLARRNDIDKDFVLKCALVLCDLPVNFRVEQFTESNMGIIGARWGQIKRAIEVGFSLVNSFGIDRTNLTSTYAVIPAIYYLMRHPELRVSGTTPFDVNNAQAIRKWLAFALLARQFGSGPDTVLQKARAVIRAEASRSPDFPLGAIVSQLGFAPERLTGVITNRVQHLTYDQPLSFLALTLLYDETDWATKQYTQDHIFPRSIFTEARLSAANIRPTDHGRYIAMSESLSNLELLLGPENLEKSNQAFETWIGTRDAGFKQRHLIPTDSGLYTLQKFPAFIKAREKLILDRLKQVFT